MTTIARDLLLLALRPDGHWLGGGTGPDEALGAAALTQLVMDGHAAVDDSGVTLTADAPLPDGIRETLRGTTTVDAAIGALGPWARAESLQALADEHVLRVERKKVLGLVPVTDLTVLDAAEHRAPLDRLAEVIDDRSSRLTATERAATVMLIAILDAAGLLPLLLPVSQERLAALTAADDPAVPAALRRSLDRVRTAVFTSVILTSALPPGR